MAGNAERARELRASVKYEHLASALLRAGDGPGSVAEFLRSDYGLDSAQAQAALQRAQRGTRRPEAHISQEPAPLRRAKSLITD